MKENLSLQLINLENRSDLGKKLPTNMLLMQVYLKDRLNVSIDVYTRRSFDLISLIKTSGIGGEAI